MPAPFPTSGASTTSCQATFQYQARSPAGAARSSASELAWKRERDGQRHRRCRGDDPRDAGSPGTERECDRRSDKRGDPAAAASGQPERDHEDARQRAVKRSQPALDDEPRDRDRKPDRGEASEPVRVAERLLEERPLERVRRIRRPLEQPLPERVGADRRRFRRARRSRASRRRRRRRATNARYASVRCASRNESAGSGDQTAESAVQTRQAGQRDEDERPASASSETRPRRTNASAAAQRKATVAARQLAGKKPPSANESRTIAAQASTAPGRARRDSAPAAATAQRRKRKSASATQTGFSCPSRSIVAATRACSPPLTSSTSSTTKRARTRLPAGTGAGKRTRFSP